MSELSEGLRKHYETALARRGGNGSLIISIIAYFVLCYGASRFIHDSAYQILANIGLLIFIIFYHRHQRSEDVESQRAAAQAMPDDQLTTTYLEHQKGAQRTGLLWGVALIAIALGLLFTPQGRELLDAMIRGSQQ